MGISYYTLLGRPDNKSEWEIVFGDYDRSVCVEEQESYKDDEYYTSFKIIHTSESYTDIDSVVMSLTQEID